MIDQPSSSMTNVRSEIDNAIAAIRRRRIARSAMGEKFATIGDMPSQLGEQSELYKSLWTLCNKIGIFADIVDKLAVAGLSLHNVLAYRLPRLTRLTHIWMLLGKWPRRYSEYVYRYLFLRACLICLRSPKRSSKMTRRSLIWCALQVKHLTSAARSRSFLITYTAFNALLLGSSRRLPSFAFLFDTTLLQGFLVRV